eukprot:494519_1
MHIIIMQAMVMEIFWICYVVFFWLCCCSFIWVPVVVWWVLGYSLCFQSLCMEILWMYKKNAVKASYSGEVYSEGSGGGYNTDGHGELHTLGGDSLDAAGYTGDDIYDGYSGTVFYEGLYR